MTYRYIKNLRSTAAIKSADLSTIKSTTPTFASKAEYRDWCSNAKTNSVFYSTLEGSAPSKRISNDNPVNKIYGLVADYDAPVNWPTINADLTTKCSNLPTWYSETQSGYLRLVWEFEEPVPIAPEMFEGFMKHLSKALGLERLFAGFDDSSLRASQYFALGTKWTKVNGALDAAVVQATLVKAACERPPQTNDTSIPIAVVAKEVADRWPTRWVGDFEVGSRGPLFWIDDGIDREGCQVIEDGVVCYSERAGKGFMSWRDIFGGSFVKAFEQQKLSSLMDEYWFNGRSYFKLLYGAAVTLPKEQLVLELRQAGFAVRAKKGQPLSEVESALLTISNHNRIDEIAPVVFSAERIVTYNGQRILNCASIDPVAADSDGSESKWPFLHKWLEQLFVDSGNTKTLDYLYAWLKRFYCAVVDREFVQGQALVLVGPTNKGKSLLSNKVISALVGGYADASDYLSGQTQFNKDLGRVAAWVIDDTTSAASFQDQRKATELIKRSVANPRVAYMAKYSDALSIPWTGRVILSLNEDSSSLSVIPSLDSSNRDKIIALRIRYGATSDFPRNSELEAIIENELPHFAKFLLDWQPPKEVEGTGRFGVVSYIDETIAEAAYDNSSRSGTAELVEFFCKKHRELDSSQTMWVGTLTEFQVLLHDLNGGRSVGDSNKLEFVRRGMGALEEAGRNNPKVRPVVSKGSGGGKVWRIDLSEKYDIKF